MIREIYNVYSFGLMRYLESKGFKFFMTKTCKENIKKTIFCFEDSKELREEVQKYSNERLWGIKNGKTNL